MKWNFKVKLAITRNSVTTQTFFDVFVFSHVSQCFCLLFPGTNECADYPCKNGGTCLDLEKDHFVFVPWGGVETTVR